MGCGQSKEAALSPNARMAAPKTSTKSSSSSSKKQRHKKQTATPIPPASPELRPRVDSWAAPSTTTPQQPPPPMRSSSSRDTGYRLVTHTSPNGTVTVKKRPIHKPVELQWQQLWDTQAPYLMDPSDVNIVLDHAMVQLGNLWTAAETTLLQRKVRAALANCEPTHSSNNGGGKIRNAILRGSANGSSSHHSHHHHSHHGHNHLPDSKHVDPKTLALHYRLLHPTLLAKILPAAIPTIVLENITVLLLHLSESLWDRVQYAATQSAQRAHLDMDVNHQSQQHANSTNSPTSSGGDNNNNNNNNNNTRRPMPPPSVVPDIADAGPVLPPGVTLQALVALLGLGIKGNRIQQLHLLFYLVHGNLKQFLATHPAGGVPCWLLEVSGEPTTASKNNSSNGKKKKKSSQNNATNTNNTNTTTIVMSLASLTHYHYFGTAFLPHALAADEQLDFVPSTSRKPLAIAPQTLASVLLSAANASTGNNNSSALKKDDAAAGATMEHSEKSNGNHSNGGGGIMGRRKSNHTSSAANVDDDTPADEWMRTAAPSRLVRRIWNPSETPMDIKEPGISSEVQAAWRASLLDPTTTNSSGSSSNHDTTNNNNSADNSSADTMTLQQFANWADEYLDDDSLDQVMHHCLGDTLLPSPPLEGQLVRTAWAAWEETRRQQRQYAYDDHDDSAIMERVLSASAPQSSSDDGLSTRVWGGIGGPDGSGGTGKGLLFCVDKQWWDAWTAYIAPSPSTSGRRRRPGALLTDNLLERDTEVCIPGTLGSYEMMRKDLVLGRDYVLIPPGVWNILYEMYAGGPPLPRMVVNYAKSTATSAPTSSSKIPPVIQDRVDLHPMVIHVQLCDPLQPYRRGDVGPTSMRVMARPGQPLWRLVAEILARCFPLTAYKAGHASDGLAKARLWRRIDEGAAANGNNTATMNKAPISRYGPWQLLVKTGDHVLLPTQLPLTSSTSEDALTRVMESWDEYSAAARTGDNTLESHGIQHQTSLMLEYAVTNKSNDLYWPRELAAKAGRVRQLAEEDRKFRNFLLGQDDAGNVMLKPQKIAGTEVDAMDSSGRWYPVKILQVEIVDEETEHDEDGALIREGGSSKKVRVNFGDYGGHMEWIDVESDKLATLGRFTSESSERADGSSRANGSSNNPSGSSISSPERKGAMVVKKSTSGDNLGESTKICTYPGYGACGLTNLGNTCYINSAIQCMSYLPLLRSYLLSAQYKTTGDLNKDNPLGTGGKLLEEFAELLRTMWGARVGEKSPTRFRSQLGKINGQFSGADQQDAQEFLNYMLDVLHEDSNKVRKKPYVEALEDDWVIQNQLPRVGEEAWRRFLRRNRSIMADVSMGQVLNTVTCPKCNFSSRNFDPFNLLSIPIPTVADVLFKCTVYRRATPMNCPWVLNRARKGDKRTARFQRKRTQSVTGPPSDTFIAEEYVIPMFRMADSGDLRLKLQNACGIPANQLRLCRAEDRILDEDEEDGPFNRHTKIIPLTDKEGPCSQLAKARQSEVQGPTSIVAFETTLRGRPVSKETEEEALEDTAELDDDDDEPIDDDLIPNAHDQKLLRQQLKSYGDSRECRMHDSDPLHLSRAISRSLWPTCESEFKLGLRLDAKDHRGQWFQGSIIEISDDEVNAGDADTGQEVKLVKREIVVHFDRYESKFNEKYTIDEFNDRTLRPLFSHASPRIKPTEFQVHHRFDDREFPRVFGQPFYVECHSEWSNARAGAHILGQASRFLGQAFGEGSEEQNTPEKDARLGRMLEKAQNTVSEMIDLLVDFDREYVKQALGLSGHHENAKPFRNPGFDATSLSKLLVEKVTPLMQKLPFELRVAYPTSTGANGANAMAEESFPYLLIRTLENFIVPKSTIFIQWRVSTVKNGATKCPLLYSSPHIEMDKASIEIAAKAEAAEKLFRPGNSGMNLGVCLREFCKTQNLSLNDNWRCPRCKKFREGRQNMDLWRLPDLLTFHVKRFNMSARWREKITTRVNFPLTGLNLSEWCHEESPALNSGLPDSSVYDLIGVVNHLGGMTGGHYVATCKATTSTRDGREEEAYGFGGPGVVKEDSAGLVGNPSETVASSGWRLGGRKTEPNKTAAAESSKAVSESAEPLWLQFDDELVEPIPPRLVVSEMAYVLFYRRRQIRSSNIAKYSTLE